MTTVESATGVAWSGTDDTRMPRAQRTRIRAGSRWLHVPLAVTTIAFLLLTSHLRLSLAASLPWQCDEIPLLVRFTGLCGRATNEVEAQAFTPSLYSFRTGAIRSAHVPSYYASLHTTTGFWTNLGLHLFGYGPTAGRAGSLLWSFVAVMAAGWAAWMVVGNATAACLAIALASLAPMTAAYGAQARGYAEAMAVTMLLLIALEYLRRRPGSLLRAAFLLLVAIQASLTVYTMWVYVVLPTMLCCAVILPRRAEAPRDRHTLRVVLGVICVALVTFMTFYTAERWKQFAVASGVFGVPIDSASALARFAAELLGQASPIGLVAVPLTLAGAYVLRRSDVAWWIWPIALWMVTPALFCLATGSPGYVRNLAYLTGPVTVLSACGIVSLARRVERWVAPRAAATLAFIAVSVIGGIANAGLEGRARAILLPDWGALVKRLEAEPETHGPRYICPCLANHWQIDWYAPGQSERLVDAPVDGTIEVVFGEQRSETGERVVFRRDLDHGGIREAAIPAFLATTPPTAEWYGIRVRRFIGTETSTAVLDHGAPDAPAFVVVRLNARPSAALWQEALRTAGVQDAGLLEFSEEPTAAGLVQTMLVPGRIVPALRESLLGEFAGTITGIRSFALNPIK